MGGPWGSSAGLRFARAVAVASRAAEKGLPGKRGSGAGNRRLMQTGSLSKKRLSLSGEIGWPLKGQSIVGASSSVNSE